MWALREPLDDGSMVLVSYRSLPVPIRRPRGTETTGRVDPVGIILGMGAARARAAFVGRAGELDRLRAAAERSASGEGMALLCVGEAGIGKTRLVEEFAAESRAAGVPVLTGGCVELGSTGLPYGPFAEALRMAMRERIISADAMHAQTREQLALLVPGIGTRARRSTARGTTADASDGLGQVPLFEAVLAALEMAGQARGVTVVIEDLHWADRSTLDLLAFLVRNLAALPLMLVVTVRTDDVDRTDPLAMLLAELGRRPGVERLDLAPLDLDATCRQLRGILGFEPDPALAHRIHERADGNPFFVEQLARAYLDGETDAIPPSLRDLLLSQLSRLPQDVQRLLAAVAIAGPLASADVLATMLDQTEREVVHSLRLAVDLHVLEPVRGGSTEGYAFHHALVAEAAESDLLDGERRHLHARCADALAERRPAEGPAIAPWIGRIAYHRERSGERLKMIGASIDAAGAAEAIAAHADAFVQYSRATAALLPGEPVPHADWDRTDLFGRAGISAALAGDPTAAARLTQEALDELPADADPMTRGALLTRLSEYQWTSSDPQFVETLRLAVDVVPALPPTALRARALNALGFHHQYLASLDAARAAFEEARATALAVPRAATELAIADSCLAFFAYDDGDAGKARGLIEEGRDVLIEPAVVSHASAAWMDLVGIAAWGGDHALAVELAEEGLRRTRASGNEAYYGSLVAANGAEALLALGRLQDAMVMLDSVRTVASGGYLDGAFLTMRASLLTALGDLTRAREDLESIGEASRLGDQSIERVRAYVDAELLVSGGDPEAVRDVVEAALRLPTTHVPVIHEVGLLVWIGVRAEADLAERGRARRDTAAEAAGAARSTALLDVLERVLREAAAGVTGDRQGSRVPRARTGRGMSTPGRRRSIHVAHRHRRLVRAGVRPAAPLRADPRGRDPPRSRAERPDGGDDGPARRVRRGTAVRRRAAGRDGGSDRPACPGRPRARGGVKPAGRCRSPAGRPRSRPGCRRPGLRPDRPGGGDPVAARGGHDQPPDRRAPVHQSEDRRCPRLEPVGQDGRQRTCPGRDRRPSPGDQRAGRGHPGRRLRRLSSGVAEHTQHLRVDPAGCGCPLLQVGHAHPAEQRAVPGGIPAVGRRPGRADP